MMSEPTRLLDDPAVADGLRADLLHANSAVLEGLDLSAGVAGLKAAIAVETSAAATAGAAGGGKLLGLGILGIATAGALAWFALRGPEPDANLLAAEPSVAAVGTADDEPSLDHAPSIAEPYSAVAAPSVSQPEAPVVEPELAQPAAQPEAVFAPSIGKPQTPSAAVTRKRPRKASKQEDYLREAKLISDARAAMKTDAGAALKLLAEARSEFPRGMLREERQALTILSLDKLGRSAQAEASAKRFLEKHSEGPYAEAVRQVLE